MCYSSFDTFSNPTKPFAGFIKGFFPALSIAHTRTVHTLAHIRTHILNSIEKTLPNKVKSKGGEVDAADIHTCVFSTPSALPYTLQTGTHRESRLLRQLLDHKHCAVTASLNFIHLIQRTHVFGCVFDFWFAIKKGVYVCLWILIYPTNKPRNAGCYQPSKKRESRKNYGSSTICFDSQRNLTLNGRKRRFSLRS